jgi:hypothetical protein
LDAQNGYRDSWLNFVAALEALLGRREAGGSAHGQLTMPAADDAIRHPMSSETSTGISGVVHGP